MTDLTEPETPEVEDLPEEDATEELETEIEDDAEEQSEDEESDDEDIEPELIEVEYEGKTYRVAPELRDSIMRQADYTRKTQEVAEQRKAIEATLAKFEEMSTAERQATGEVAAYEAALQDYENVDWDALERADPNAANQHWRKYQLFQRNLEKAQKTLTEATSSREAEAQRITAERIRESVAELSKAIPGWGETKAAEMAQFAREQFGFTDDEFRAGLQDARQIKLLNLAFEAAKTTSQKKKPAAPPPKPAAKVKGGTAPRKGLDDRLSTEEWMKRRQAQLSR